MNWVNIQDSLVKGVQLIALNWLRHSDAYTYQWTKSLLYQILAFHLFGVSSWPETKQWLIMVHLTVEKTLMKSESTHNGFHIRKHTWKYLKTSAILTASVSFLFWYLRHDRNLTLFACSRHQVHIFQCHHSLYLVTSLDSWRSLYPRPTTLVAGRRATRFRRTVHSWMWVFSFLLRRTQRVRRHNSLTGPRFIAVYGDLCPTPYLRGGLIFWNTYWAALFIHTYSSSHFGWYYVEDGNISKRYLTL